MFFSVRFLKAITWTKPLTSIFSSNRLLFKEFESHTANSIPTSRVLTSASTFSSGKYPEMFPQVHEAGDTFTLLQFRSFWSVILFIGRLQGYEIPNRLLKQDLRCMRNWQMNLYRKAVFNLDPINIPITVKGYVSFFLLSVIILSRNGQ